MGKTREYQGTDVLAIEGCSSVLWLILALSRPVLCPSLHHSSQLFLPFQVALRYPGQAWYGLGRRRVHADHLVPGRLPEPPAKVPVRAATLPPEHLPIRNGTATRSNLQPQ